MLFPFTFRLSVPGLSNPFTSTSSTSTSTNTALPAHRHPPTPVDSSKNHAVFHITPPHITGPSSRKRAWDPSFAVPSQSTISLTSTNGYLDTPAKYRNMVTASPNRAIADEFHEVGMFLSHDDGDDTDLPPPAKRRRGLAGSIVSTAVSAALIGTAVGLTVYRLWRDRGKEPPRLEDPHHQQSPPPPYTLQESHLLPSSSALPSSSSKPLQIAPTPPTTPSRNTTSRKSRHTTALPTTATTTTPSSSAGRRRTHYTPTTRARTTGTRGRQTHVYNHLASTSQALFPPTRPEFDFTSSTTTTTTTTTTAAAITQPSNEVEDQMDWIGDKLTILIEQGKRALGREVVVMSEDKEDEVDDGCGGWEEVEVEPIHTPSLSRSRSSSSMRRTKRPRELMHSASYSQLHYLSHARSKSDVPSRSSLLTPPPPMSSRSADFDFSNTNTTTTPNSSGEQGEQGWESPELKELMERARERYHRR